LKINDIIAGRNTKLPRISTAKIPQKIKTSEKLKNKPRISIKAIDLLDLIS
jgi:hypothetical protein